MHFGVITFEFSGTHLGYLLLQPKFHADIADKLRLNHIVHIVVPSCSVHHGDVISQCLGEVHWQVRSQKE